MSGKDRDRPSDEFARGLGDVEPIADRSKHVKPTSRPASGPVSETARERFIHPEADEPRFAHRPHATALHVEQLRSGALTYQRKLDLHQRRADSAQQALVRAIKASARAGETVLLVIHGRGKHTGGVSVLREELPEWLESNDRVVAYAPAQEADGGAGATLVLLRSP